MQEQLRKWKWKKPEYNRWQKSSNWQFILEAPKNLLRIKLFFKSYYILRDQNTFKSNLSSISSGKLDINFLTLIYLCTFLSLSFSLFTLAFKLQNGLSLWRLRQPGCFCQCTINNKAKTKEPLFCQ
jgi:hypothetical protein